MTNKNSFELANSHCAADEVKKLLLNVLQMHHHPVVKEVAERTEEVRDPIVDSSSISVGCCSIFGFCRPNF